jgi:hypothetical protein
MALHKVSQWRQLCKGGNHQTIKKNKAFWTFSAVLSQLDLSVGQSSLSFATSNCSNPTFVRTKYHLTQEKMSPPKKLVEVFVRMNTSPSNEDRTVPLSFYISLPIL